MGRLYTCRFLTIPVALTGAAQLGTKGISSCCYYVTVRNHRPWAGRQRRHQEVPCLLFEYSCAATQPDSCWEGGQLSLPHKQTAAGGGVQLPHKQTDCTPSIKYQRCTLWRQSSLNSSKWHIQRERMGLLEYQAMPSLHDKAHDRWLCTFTI
jgi:hypothetical protein